MSINFKTKIIATCILGVVLGFSSRYLLAENKQRGPASVELPKLMPLKIGKHLAVLTAEIKTPTEIPAKDDQEVQLIGYISVQQNLEGDLHYEWNLPEGVSVVEGQLSDDLHNVVAGQTVKVHLNVTGFSKESQKLITLQASALKGKLQFGNSAVISSRSEDTWESIAPQMKEESVKQLSQ